VKLLAEREQDSEQLRLDYLEHTYHVRVSQRFLPNSQNHRACHWNVVSVILPVIQAMTGLGRGEAVTR
jgi:hypothetical protein